MIIKERLNGIIEINDNDNGACCTDRLIKKSELE